MPRADTCPICHAPTVANFKPFCSQGCRDRDLLNWLGEGYRVPGDPAEPDIPAPAGLDSNRDAD